MSADNPDTTRETAGIQAGEEYDKAREKRLEEQGADGKELGDSRSSSGGLVSSGTGAPGNLVTQFPGVVERGLADDVNEGGKALRASKGLPTDGVTADDRSWTAQSALAYVADNAQDVPGQTYTLAELPDPLVVNASSLPAHTIGEHLVVDSVKTDDINSSQEGGDVATSPRHAGYAPQAKDAKVGGRAAGRSRA